MITSIKLGCHVRWKKPEHATAYAKQYPFLSSEDAYEVVHLEKRFNMHAVHCLTKVRPEPVAIWSKHLASLPRCTVCDQEGHTSKQKDQCPDQAEKRR